VRAAIDFSALTRELVAVRRAKPEDDLISDLAATELTDDEVVASVILLLNAGHEASVNAFGNGLPAILGAYPEFGRTHAPTDRPAWSLVVEEMLRYDAPLQLFERTAIEPVEVGGITVEPGQKIAALLGSANRDPEVFEQPDELVLDRDPNPHLAFGAGVHFCLGAPLARMELGETLPLLFEVFPGLALDGEPESRGTFVLRGNHRVPVKAS
jgi:unspecific monooxygenase